ncbi:MAG: hypothetical protein ACPKPY_04405 [Nitrososphaeraceae archaeon]
MSSQINIFPIESKPLGLTYGEWCIKWWQWICSIPKNNNPLFDWSGNNANVNQNDPHVLFLCQTYEGVKSTPSRKNVITKGRSIFMPIINWISIMYHDGNSDQELLEIAKNKMDVVGPLEITINGITINKGLEKYRVLSPFFEIYLPENNFFGLSSGERRCISDGYWIFLPFIYEDLKLSSFSSCSSGITKIKVKYELKTVT